jgi:hypothetical protein
MRSPDSPALENGNLTRCNANPEAKLEDFSGAAAAQTRRAFCRNVRRAALLQSLIQAAT